MAFSLTRVGESTREEALQTRPGSESPPQAAAPAQSDPACTVTYPGPSAAPAPALSR